jgi:hypothetical protein
MRAGREAAPGGRQALDTAAIGRRLALHGLIPRGAFHPDPADGVPPSAGTVVLVGNAGPAMWQAFARDRRDEANPLDAWTRSVLTAAARDLGAVTVLFPFDGPRPYPFQRWAMKADAVHSSPIGVLVHPDFGLWHAYRGALAFAGTLALPPRDGRASPCESCANRPCLSACPVSAFRPGAYDVPACAGHLTSHAGSDCLTGGCLARRACPVGRDYIYEPAQAAFHMEAFLGLRR